MKKLKIRMLGASLGVIIIIMAHLAGASLVPNLQIYEFSKNIGLEYGVSIYKNSCCEGYTLLNVLDSNLMYTLLIDMNGTEIKRWNLDPSPAKMLPNGNLIGGGFITNGSLEYTNAVTQIDWDGNIVWNFCNWTIVHQELSARMHHDFQREGNPVGYYAPGQEGLSLGKTLILSRENMLLPQISRKELIDDVIYEVDWDGNLTGFEWHAIDHIDEFGFNLRQRIGIFLKPGLYYQRNTIGNGDLFHINTISLLGENRFYNEGYEQFNPENIMICSRHTNTVAIINRETGKLVWKIGPQYTKRTAEGCKLGQIIGPHFAHMIPSGLPGEGNILLFDNGGWAGYSIFGTCNRFRGYSRVIEFDPITLDIIWGYSNKRGLPFKTSRNSDRFFSPLISSAQRLPNGNTLITEGSYGRIFEVTSENEIVWKFIIQNMTPVYRAYRVPPKWVPGNPSRYSDWQ
ncbi:MAG: aryl-sulfate sulfotransferase [Candidatus Thermoplasmatota archaeon]|nr:aryl-sulfate sulfotransferase [Candidatus Thermoplasmatota archaeon]